MIQIAQDHQETNVNRAGYSLQAKQPLDMFGFFNRVYIYTHNIYIYIYISFRSGIWISLTCLQWVRHIVSLMRGQRWRALGCDPLHT